MKQVKINLYTLSELKNINEKVYQKVLDNERDDIINIRFDYASCDVYYILKDRYNIDIDEKNIYYSISYSQGDGFCFIDNDILSYTRLKNKSDLNAFEKWILNNLNDNDFNMLLEYLNDGYNLSIIRNSHQYCHCYTCIIDYETFYSSDDPNYIDNVNDLIYILCKKLFNEVYVNICKDIETYLYSLYDVDDNDVIDTCNANEYFYDKNGVLYVD